MEEVWKFIDGFDWAYQVSNLGRVRTLDRVVNTRNGRCVFCRGELLNQHINRHGYSYVFLRKNGKGCSRTVHRLVSFAFIPTVNGKPDINHKDGNKLNNCADNLEWCTQLENMNHAYANGLVPKPTKQPIDIYCLELDTHYSSTKEAADKLGVRVVKIRDALRLHRVIKVQGLSYTFIRGADIEAYLNMKTKLDNLLSWQFSAIETDLGVYFCLKK